MSMQEMAARADLSWMRQLRPDPEAAQHAPNKKSRQVKSGHYVPVRPTPLPQPKLIIHSPEMAAELGISEEACSSQEFLRFFSGDVDALTGFESWATPYALCIMGRPMYDNCPFKNGNGYGDGRAVSVGEVIGPKGQRWEMQLKGGGQTPFCRGADGRAVLRSSVREFLASEAMHHLGISTTRALSLIVSGGETTQRPWYSGDAAGGAGLPELPPGAPPELRQMLAAMMRERQSEPDVMIREQCAITCRVAPSFMRIGHLDLFARRASRPDATELQREEHEMIVQHALDREFADVLPGAPLAERALAMFEAAAQRIGAMVAGWLRVGFCQGNFNCDNCLVAGRQMDYGPFGFLERYEPLWNMWVGGAEKYGFLNQPQAACKNFESLAAAVAPILSDEQQGMVPEIVEEFKRLSAEALDDVWRRKLGLDLPEEGAQLFASLEPLLRASGADWTLFWRSLARVPGAASPDASDGELMEPLRTSLGGGLTAEGEARWAEWLREWLAASPSGPSMRQANPKYVPREWMLVEAYSAAQRGDRGPLEELQALFREPYAEWPELEDRFFRTTPPEAVRRGGTAFMS